MLSWRCRNELRIEWKISWNKNFVDNIYIQPAASDNGVSLGAAQLLNMREGVGKKPKNGSMLIGGQSSTDS